MHHGQRRRYRHPGSSVHRNTLRHRCFTDQMAIIAERKGREALLNALRHSQANRIEIELKYSAKQLRVFVRDNGSGIDSNILKSGRDGHWGLSSVRERADRFGARLQVLSRPSAGTEIEVVVPAYLAFQDPLGRKRRRFGDHTRETSGSP